MQLAVAIIHGIGNQPNYLDLDGQHTYAQDLIHNLQRRLGPITESVAFQSIYWADVPDKRELAYLEASAVALDASHGDTISR